MKNNRILWFNLIALLLLFVKLANTQDTLPSQYIDEITVSTSRLINRSKSLAFTTKMDSQRMSQSRGFALGDALQNTTSAFVTSTENFSQDMRIALRGFGMRSAFGIRGIKIVVDGIPESTPDGQGDVDNIEPLLISSATILAGPANGTYSNASGGVIELTSMSNPYPILLQSSTSLGSYGLFKQNGILGIKKSKLDFLGSLSYLKNMGYRTNSNFKNIQYYSKLNYTLSDKTTARLTFNGFDSPIALDPGGITELQYRDNPSQAREQNITYKAGETVKQNRIAAQLISNLTSQTSSLTNLHITKRIFSNNLPFTNAGSVHYDRTYWGAMSSFKRKSLLTSNDEWNIGIDVEGQIDLRKRFDNLLGIEGPLRLDQKEQFQTTSFYSQFFIPKGKNYLDGNLRIERIGIKITDTFLTDGDQSGNQSYLPLSGKLALGRLFLSSLNAQIAVSSGFETPTLTEISSNELMGGFSDVNPARTNGFELMIKFANNHLSIQSNSYYYASSNELIPYQIASQAGRVFYKNGGESTRIGTELSITGQITKGLSIDASTSLGKYTFDDKILTSKLLGVPTASHLIQFNVLFGKHIRATSSYKYISSMYLNDANTFVTQPQQFLTTNLSANYKMNAFSISPAIGLRQVISDDAFSNLLINAVGSRYFEAMPRTYLYASVSFSFHP